jgi:hypothetical protein
MFLDSRDPLNGAIDMPGKIPSSSSKRTKSASLASKAEASASPAKSGASSASRLIDQRIRELGDWRGKTLARLRALVHRADPEVLEEWKWRGVPVWSHGGIVCTGETYKEVVKMTFAKGASLDDPSRLFNSSLEGNTRRAIDFHEGEKIDEEALTDLVREAVALNLATAEAKSARKGTRSAATKATRSPRSRRAR